MRNRFRRTLSMTGGTLAQIFGFIGDASLAWYNSVRKLWRAL